MAEWYLWRDEVPRPGWRNMAIDQALLDRADREGEAWLRLYRWRPHCLSFGRHEPAHRRYDAGRIRSLGLDVVRRPTGGRAVWHGRELTYAVAAPSARLGSLREAYLAIHAVLCRAVAALGLEAELAPAPAGPTGVEAGACFAVPAGGEIVVRGRKVVGSAQLRQGAGLLQHGSILLDDDQRTVAAVTRRPVPSDLAAPLAALVGHPIPCAEMARLVAEAAAEAWPGSWRQVGAPEPILGAAASHALRFRSPAWTWRGDPAPSATLRRLSHRSAES